MIAFILMCAMTGDTSAPEIKPNQAWEVISDNAWAYLGRPVKFLGDVTGDGIADVLAGAVCDEKDRARSSEGIVRCLSGADGRLVFTCYGEAANARLGADLAALDDLTGDGIPDFAATVASGIQLRSGSNGALVRCIALCEVTQPPFWRMVSCPDTDGDDKRDLLVAVGDEPAMCGTGHTVYPGSLTIISTSDGATLRHIDGPSASGERFGLAAAAIADLDADGVPDLCVDSPFEGSLRVFSGATGTMRLHLRAADRHVGGSLVGVSDVNGDGAGDIVVSAYDRDKKSVTRWAGLHLISGRDGSRLGTWPLDQRQPWWSKCELATLPDLDGDGVRDLAVGDADDRDYRGRVLLLSLRHQEPLASLTGASASTLFGASIDTIDDLGGGRGPALVVGAISDKRRAEGAGSVTLVLLRPPK